MSRISIVSNTQANAEQHALFDAIQAKLDAAAIEERVKVEAVAGNIRDITRGATRTGCFRGSPRTGPSSAGA